MPHHSEKKKKKNLLVHSPPLPTLSFLRNLQLAHRALSKAREACSPAAAPLPPSLSLRQPPSCQVPSPSVLCSAPVQVALRPPAATSEERALSIDAQDRHQVPGLLKAYEEEDRAQKMETLYPPATQVGKRPAGLSPPPDAHNRKVQRVASTDVLTNDVRADLRRLSKTNAHACLFSRTTRSLVTFSLCTVQTLQRKLCSPSDFLDGTARGSKTTPSTASQP